MQLRKNQNRPEERCAVSLPKLYENKQPRYAFPQLRSL